MILGRTARPASFVFFVTFCSNAFRARRCARDEFFCEQKHTKDAKEKAEGKKPAKSALARSAVAALRRTIAEGQKNGGKK